MGNRPLILVVLTTVVLTLLVAGCITCGSNGSHDEVKEAEIESVSTSAGTFRSDEFYLQVDLPTGWAAAEGPEALISTAHLIGQVAFNSWGEEGFWVHEVRIGSSSIYGGPSVISQLPEGGAYIVLVHITMPPPIGFEPEEYSASDLCGLLTSRDWRLGSGFNNFNISKWGQSLELQIACDPAATDETVEQVNSILESWRFDKYPAGNVGWAIVFARELIPDEVQPFPRYTGYYGGDGGTARGIEAEVGEDKTVHFRFTYYWDVPSLGSFRDNLASSPQHWWTVEVSPVGGTTLTGEGGDPLPFN